MIDRTTASPKLLAFFSRKALTPSQQAIARYLIDHPDEVLYLSSTSLGRRLGISQSSVTRFAKVLGFDGYFELRERCRSLLQEDNPQPTAQSHFERVVSSEIDNLQFFRQQLSTSIDVQRLGKVLASSRPLVALGLRESAVTAQYFGMLAREIHPDVRIITTSGSAAADDLARARKRGANSLLAYCLPRYPAETLRAIHYAHSLGYRITMIADSPAAPGYDLADDIVTIRMASELVFGSLVTPILLTSILIDAICDADPEQAKRGLEDFETRAREFGFYADASPVRTHGKRAAPNRARGGSHRRTRS